MKTKKIVGIALVACILLLSSCDRFYFDKPLPVDAPNQYEFPAKFRGLWVEKDDSTIIGKDHFMKIRYEQNVIAKQDAEKFYKYMQKDGKIYTVDTDGMKLDGPGFPYTEKNDTVRFTERYVYEIALGRMAFLRKVNDHYILNVKDENQWWEIILLSETKEGSLLAKCPGKKDEEKMDNAKLVYSAGGNHHYECAWTKADIEKYISTGGFSDTVICLDLSKKIKLK